MAWTAGVDHSASVVTVAEWNTYLGTAGSLNYLKTAVDAPMRARKNSGGSVFGGRAKFNLIEGANVTLTVADDAGSDEIDVTIAASGSTLPTQSAGSGAVNVTTAAVQSTKGAWVQLIASTGFAVVEVVICLNIKEGNATNSFQLDIGTGTGGSEVVKIADLVQTMDSVNGTAHGVSASWSTPFSIAASTRIAARVANMSTATQVTGVVGVTVFG